MTPILIIEKFSIAAPLGLCFHDAATGERIGEGLEVSVYPATQNVLKRRTTALPNRVGVYVLHKASGLEDFTKGAGDDEFWQSNPPDKTFVVEVFDNEKRFQPFSFNVKLPVRGIYKWENIPPGSPNKNLSSIPMYSATARKTLGGMSVIRGHLRQADGVPASWAVLEAAFEGNLVARGVADKDGQIVLLFPSLAPQTNPVVSPPKTATRVSLSDQQWNLDLTVKYQPNIFQTSPPASAESVEEKFPDLRLVLAQAEGQLWADAEQTVEYETAVLRFGKELILRSRAKISSPMPNPDKADSSFLFVSPAV